MVPSQNIFFLLKDSSESHKYRVKQLIYQSISQDPHLKLMTWQPEGPKIFLKLSLFCRRQQQGPFLSKWTVIVWNKQSCGLDLVQSQKSGSDAKGGVLSVFVNIKPSKFQSCVDLWMPFSFGTFCLCLSPSKTLTVQPNGSLHRRKSGRLRALHAPRWPDQWALTSSIYLRKHSHLANMHQPVTTSITPTEFKGSVVTV